MFNEIMIVTGIFWSLTYVLIIKQGFKDKTFGMPFVALAANISWEAIFSFVHPHPVPQLYINYAWFSLDLVIVFQFLKYGIKEFKIAKKYYILFALAVGISSCVIYLVCYFLDDWQGAYVSFGQNLVMSALFITMLHGRKSLRGQSIYIAIFKMLGTASASVAFYLYQPISHQTLVLPVFYVLILACDVAYVVLVHKKSRECNMPTWKRL